MTQYLTEEILLAARENLRQLLNSDGQPLRYFDEAYTPFERMMIMSEQTQEEKDAVAAARQEFRMQLDQVLADLVQSKQINVDVSNKIREGMSIDASKNVEVNVGTATPAAAPADDDDDTPSKSGRYVSKKK